MSERFFAASHAEPDKDNVQETSPESPSLNDQEVTEFEVAKEVESNEPIEESLRSSNETDREHDSVEETDAHGITHERVMRGSVEYDVFTIPVRSSGRNNTFITAMTHAASDRYTVGAFRANKEGGYGEPSDLVDRFELEESAEAFALQSPELQALCQKLGGTFRGVYKGQGLCGIEIVKGETPSS